MLSDCTDHLFNYFFHTLLCAKVYLSICLNIFSFTHLSWSLTKDRYDLYRSKHLIISIFYLFIKHKSIHSPLLYSISLSVHPTIYSFIYKRNHQFMYFSNSSHQSNHPFVCPNNYAIQLFICRLIQLYIHLFICLSVQPFLCLSLLHLFIQTTIHFSATQLTIYPSIWSSQLFICRSNIDLSDCSNTPPLMKNCVMLLCTHF